MGKRKISIGIMMILIINMILLALPTKTVFSEVNDSISVAKGIKDILTYENKIIIITSDGQAKLITKGEEGEVYLNGSNYNVISKNLIINESGDIFNVLTEEYESKEVSEEYYNLYNNLSNRYEFDSMYLLKDRIALISSNNGIYEINYYSIESNEIIENITTLETNSIDFDKNGQLYIDGKGSLSAYIDGQINNVKEISNTYKVRVYDDNKIVLFNEFEYKVLDNGIEEDQSMDIDNSDINNESNKQEIEINDRVNEPVVMDGSEGVSYQTHIEDMGWQQWKTNGQVSGTEGLSRRLEAIKINIQGLPEGANISYRTHVQNQGWQNWVSNGQISGTEGKELRLEGIQIKLENAEGYSIQYRVHVQDIGWQSWRKDGQTSGTEGQSKRLEAIEIKIVQDNIPDGLTYSTLVKNEGWKENISEGETAGSSGVNTITALKLNFNNSIGANIQYRAHVQNEGWQNWVSNGEIAGDKNGKNNIEAIDIKLINTSANYHVKYRVKTKNYGWQSWNSDGESAGTTGLSGEIIAIEVKIVKDIDIPQVKYQTHVQDEGWQQWKSNGQVSGTEGKSRRLEGIKIELSNLESSNSIIYRTHVQDEGWQNWVSNGQVSGTEGKARRLEGIQIKLQNEIPGYKLYYRVHVQDEGWQEWKTNGETAGTVGKFKRLEAIEVKLVKDKDKMIVIDAGHNYGGDDGAYATHSGIRYSERDLNMSMAVKLKRALESYGFDIVMTRNPEDRDTIALRESLKKRVNIANNLDADFFISIHQNSSTASSANGVEVYYSTATPLSGGELLKSGIEYRDTKSRAYSASEKVSKSKAISKAIVDSIASNMSRTNRGSKDNDYFVVKNTYMPSVLVECGFISNAAEAKKLASSSLQKTMSDLIAKEINKQF